MFLLTFFFVKYNIIMKGGKMKKINSVQNWLPYQEILENGIIKQKKQNM